VAQTKIMLFKIIDFLLNLLVMHQLDSMPNAFVLLTVPDLRNP
jgi:hypothetical protein